MNNDETLESLELEIAMFVRAIRNEHGVPDKNQELRRASYLILLLLKRKGPSGVKAIAETLHLDISTVSRQAAGLMDEGLLNRTQSDTDRRSYLYELNAEGTDALIKSRPGRQQRFSNMINEWDDSEINEFARLLHKFNRTK